MNVDYFVFLIYSDAVLIQREVLCCILHRCGEGWVVADRCTVVVRNRSVLQQGLAVYFVAGDVITTSNALPFVLDVFPVTVIASSLSATFTLSMSDALIVGCAFSGV